MNSGPKPTVRVLLSVYFGRRYLQEQLDSLKAQRDVIVRLAYHMDSVDDGSDKMILTAFPEADRLQAEPGLGLPDAFFELMRSFDDNSDFYAFCDQDDVWHPDKLSAASSFLKSHPSTPALWICEVSILSDPDREVRRAKPPAIIRQPSFGNALVETISPGCTMVWNRAMNQILLAGLPREGARMHDAWVYLVSAAFGSIGIERKPFVTYRIHEANAIGVANSWQNRILRERRNPGGTRHALSNQARELLANYEQQLTTKHVRNLQVLIDWNRKSLIGNWLKGRFPRRNFSDGLFLLLLFLQGKRRRQLEA